MNAPPWEGSPRAAPAQGARSTHHIQDFQRTATRGIVGNSIQPQHVGRTGAHGETGNQRQLSPGSCARVPKLIRTADLIASRSEYQGSMIGLSCGARR